MREKLIELLSENISEFCKLSVIRGTTKITAIKVDADKFANCLIANGVTIPVRCKDCKEWLRNRGVVDSPNGHCFYHETHMNGYDFCSYGERRSDGSDQ